MRLPSGITGFYNTRETRPPSLPAKEIKKQCYAVIQHAGAKVISFSKATYPKNYYTICLQLNNKQLYMLINEHYPFAAFATKLEDGDIVFTDCPPLFEACTPYFTVLSQEVLLSPINFRDGLLTTRFQLDNELTEVEYEQLMYWNPTILGEIIFNSWD
ncbi:hypothetical protein CN918_30060 [Priestia megaterium]|nr:hypothetical protein CN918_30060 [Priestia megaterium]